MYERTAEMRTFPSCYLYSSHQIVTYNLIAFDERVTFWHSSGHCLVRVRMLHYLCVGSRITITQSLTHAMQQTHMHKAVTGRVEAKKLLSR